MNPEFLREFITIADTGNFSKAAAKLFVTQPTLSKHISALEKDLGLRLFERNAISTRLTYAGESFIPYAREIVTADDRANAWITEYKKAKPLHLVIELFAGFKVTDDLASLIKLKLSEKYPSAVLEIKDIREGDSLEDLRNNNCDLVFAAIPENADVAGLMNVPVNTEQLAAIVNKMKTALRL